MDVKEVSGEVIEAKQHVLLSVHGSNGNVHGQSRVRTNLLIRDPEGSETAVTLDDDVACRVGHRATVILVKGDGAWQVALCRNHDLEVTWRFAFDVAKGSTVRNLVLATLFGSLSIFGGFACIHSGIELPRASATPTIIGVIAVVVGATLIYSAVRARKSPNEAMEVLVQKALAKAGSRR